MDGMTHAESTRFDQLRKLTEISRALTYTTGVDQIMPLAAARAAELLRAERALLMLLDRDGLLQIAATYGVTDAAVEQFREPLDETLGRRVQGLLGISEADSFVGVPLVAGGAVKGLLGVVRSGVDPCTEEEEWLLSAVADQVAVAIENSRLEEEVRKVRTEGVEAAREAGESGDAKDRALATLSHDLRSPLNAIDSYAELMEMEILGPVTDRQREALGRIRLGGRHLLGVLQNVLEMARIEAGVVRVNTESVQLARVIEEAATIVRHDAMAREQTLQIEPGEGVFARADPDRIRQVLINLLGNAIKYTPERGSIRIGAARDRNGKGSATIFVSDTGPGIPPKHLEAIFEPYYRVVGAESGTPEGAGLGLAISRELIRQMGGELTAESEPGAGATFIVRLPAVDQ
jgi:phosphoserine phosphatase RsbU/P